MGGDGGVNVTVPAAVQSVQKIVDLHLHLVGDEAKILPLLSQLGATQMTDRITVLHTSQRVCANDKPTNILRKGKTSSMFLAVELVKSGQVQAMVSAGDTGALLLSGRHLLKTIAGIDKPAIVATIPAASRQSFLLDVGANVDCKADQLFQFAVMGTVLAESLNLVAKARVGLLNIGVENYKGTEQVKLAAELLEGCDQIEYIGYIEGNDLYEGMADVVVCDGFVGNVTIKSSAGVASKVNRLLLEQTEGGLSNRFKGFFVRPLLAQLRTQINPSRFNGPSLLGLQGSIVKSHGNANIEGFFYAIQQAVNEVENSVPELITDRVATIMGAGN